MEFKNVGVAIKQYVSMRDKLFEWKKKRDEEEAKRKAALEEIEMWLLQQADVMGVESFKTSFGTAYKVTEEHYRIQDWDTFVEYVKETDNFQLFQKRVTKTAAKEIYSETGELPKGLDYFQEYKINVRRPTK